MIEKTPLDLLKEPLTLLNLVESLELCTWVLPSPDASSDIGDPKLWGLLLAILFKSSLKNIEDKNLL